MGLVRPHGLTHELAGGDTVRLSVQNGGTQLNRHRTLNAGTGLTATEDSANRRVTLAVGDEGITSRMLAPVVIEQRCTGNTTINSGTDTDLTGATMSVTPAIASMAVVFGVFDFSGGSVGDLYRGVLDVDGANEGALAIYDVAVVSSSLTLVQVWVFPLTAAAHTIKLQGRRDGGAGSCTVIATHTKLVLILVGDANVTNDTSS